MGQRGLEVAPNMRLLARNLRGLELSRALQFTVKARLSLTNLRESRLARPAS